MAIIGCAAATLASGAARAQWAGTVQGAYNRATVTLNDGQFLPIQIDQNGNLKVDCVVGCGGGTGGGGGGGGTVAQGTAGSASNAWPVTITLGGAGLANGNPLPTNDVQNGTPISGASMPAGGAGTLGWLSAIQKSVSGNLVTTDSADGAAPASPGVANAGSGLLGWLATIAGQLGGTLLTNPAGLTGTPTVNSGSLSAGGTVLTAASGKRLHLKVWNFAAAGGSPLYCSDDGSTPTVTNASFIVYAQGGYERDTPGWVPSAAIACIPATGAVPFRAESYP